MEEGTIVRGEQGIAVRFDRGRARGILFAVADQEVFVLAEILSGDDTVELVSRRGELKAQIHVWEAKLGTSPTPFKFTVEGLPETRRRAGGAA